MTVLVAVLTIRSTPCSTVITRFPSVLTRSGSSAPARQSFVAECGGAATGAAAARSIPPAFPAAAGARPGGVCAPDADVARGVLAQTSQHVGATGVRGEPATAHSGTCCLGRRAARVAARRRRHADQPGRSDHDRSPTASQILTPLRRGRMAATFSSDLSTRRTQTLAWTPGPPRRTRVEPRTSGRFDGGHPTASTIDAEVSTCLRVPFTRDRAAPHDRLEEDDSDRPAGPCRRSGRRMRC